MAEPSDQSVFSAKDVVVSYGDQTVLDCATLSINEGERIGMVGRNGSGKSTFLRLVAGELDPDSGIISRRKGLLTGYLPQDFALDETATVQENILEGTRHIRELIQSYESLPPGSEEAGTLLDRINHLDGWNLDARMRGLITHLDAPEPDRRVTSLSGGEKRRVALCRAIIGQPDLLILDEPTNHLDTGSIEWLETFLSRYAGSCLFVTHDRYFLEKVTNRILELSNGRFFSHHGNYTEYLIAKAERQAGEEAAEARRQRFLKRELSWVRSGVKARTTKSKHRLDTYFKVAEDQPPEREEDIELLIPPCPKLGNKVIEVQNLTMELGGKTLFENLTLKIEKKQRVGIIGLNGSGKTTLLRIIMGDLEPTSGVVERGVQVKINYADQNRLSLNEENTVYQEVGGNSEKIHFGDQLLSVRAYLRRFLFTDDRINLKIRQLSGGERNRILLAKILKNGGNVLVLDEPTNDLDLATLRVLEEALIAFPGTVLVVSHDRYFLNRVCTAVIAIESNGQVFHNVGNYDYYLEKRGPFTAPLREKKEIAPKPFSQKTASKPRKLKWKEERELENMEETILEAEEEVARLEALFAAPDFYEKHGQDWKQLEGELQEGKKRVETLYARWEELEAIKAASNEE